MELWQMYIVGGFALADGTSAKALTGVDDHSRMCVCARLMARERTRAVCDGLRAALGASASTSATPVSAEGDRTSDDWVSRRVTTNAVVCVAWQQVSVGRHHAGACCDVHVDGELLRFWIRDQLVKTAARTSHGEVRNKRALRTDTGT
jgi:hypothetical protein